MTIVNDTERLIYLFVEIEKYIDRLIADTIAKNPNAQSLLFWRRRSQLVHARLLVLRSALLKTTRDLISASYKTGMAIVLAESADQAASKEVDKLYQFGSGINQRAVALLAAGMNDRLDAALATVGRRVDDEFRKAGLRSTAYHATAGTSPVQAAKQMEAQLRRDSIRAFTDRAGREWTLQNYTRMVIRTTTREAVSQGTFQGLKQTGHELVQVSHHVNSCKICLPYDGNTYCLPDASAEMLAKYPLLDQTPPFHPNCKHIIGPATAEFEANEARLLAKYGAAA